jgi:hypothetical protein
MKCTTYECENETAPGYKYCNKCYVEWLKNKSQGEPAPPDRKTTNKPWHEDPIVDALLKINANLGNIEKAILRLGDKE